MRRLLPTVIAALLVMTPAAAAQVPTPTLPVTPPATGPVPADMKITRVGGLRDGKGIYNVPRDRVRVDGRINRAAAGEAVTVELWRRGKRRQHVAARVASGGHFFTFLRPSVAGHYAVRAVHKKSGKVDAGHSRRVAFTAIVPHASRGSAGVRVRLLQRQLALLHYAIPKSGHYDGATARAVLAYRKVNGMRRIGSANYTIFRRLFHGKGMFRLRYPHAGKHVEGDLRHQVLVLAQNGKPWRVYHMSSGKPSTPTVRGRFRFYRKQPGFNSHGMYYSSYFIGGYAIHGYASVPAHAASHGCIRVPVPSAHAIYRWISLGDRIFVYR